MPNPYRMVVYVNSNGDVEQVNVDEVNYAGDVVGIYVGALYPFDVDGDIARVCARFLRAAAPEQQSLPL